MKLLAAITLFLKSQVQAQRERIILGDIMVDGTIFATLAHLASSAWNAVSSLFNGGTRAINEFAEALTNAGVDFDTHVENLRRLQELYERHPGLVEEASEAYRAFMEEYMSHDVAEVAEQWGSVQWELQNVNRELSALEESTGVSRQTAALALMELAIDSAAGEIEALKAAYNVAFDTAYASINAQIGLFDRLNFEVSKNVSEMASTWGGQAADINQHNDNLLFAIEANLLPGIISSFQDINEAGHLNEVISSLQDAGAEMVNGELVMTEAAQAIVDGLNDAFGEQLNARQALADTIAGMQVDLEAGAAEILQNFKEMIDGLNLSAECREAGIATIQGLIAGMQSQEGAVEGAAANIAQGLLNAMKDALSMNSPSLAMKDIGKGSIEGLIQGTESKQDDLVRTYEEVGQSALDAMLEALDPMPAESQAIVEESLNNVRQEVADMRGPVKASFSELGAYMMAGLYEAMAEGERQAMARAHAIAEAIRRTIAAAFKVNSPSRVMIDLFGRVMDGIYVGMDRGEDAVLKRAEDIAENLTDALTIDPKTIENMVCKMQAIVDTGVISPRGALAPAGIAASGTSSGGPVYNISNTAYVTAPEAMSEYQITRELSDMSRRMRRQLG